MWSYEECVAIDSWLQAPIRREAPGQHPCRRCGTPATNFIVVLQSVGEIPLCDDCTDEHHRQEAEA